MDEKKWKKDNKPASCTQAPWAIYIPFRDRPEVLRLIRQESIDAYGYSMDECPNRRICISKECIGRPLPWKSETALPFLKELQKTHKIQDEKLYIGTNCQQCPLVKSCNFPCNQVTDYIERDKTQEPNITYNENLEKLIPKEIEAGKQLFFVDEKNIPWDCITTRSCDIIKEYIYRQRDFRAVAKKFNLFNQAAAKYKLYLTLNKLSEYAIMREFIKNNKDKLTKKQDLVLNKIYFENKSKTKVAEELNISKQAVQQLVTRVVEKYKIKWKKFTRKEKGKTLYNTAEVIK